MLSDYNRALLDRLKKRMPGATQGQIDWLQAEVGAVLPPDYLDALTYCNGAEGDMGGTRFWFQLWQVDEVVSMKDEYGVPEFAPGLIPFSSDGGGTLFGIDARSRDPMTMDFVQFDAVNLGWGREEFRCRTFTEFLDHLAIA
jgi:hypothetical protein